MEVIRKGREQKGWAKEFECTGEGNGDGGCGAILLVEENDIFISGYINGSYRETGDPVFSFKCPECGVETDLDDQEVPQHIKRNLILKSR